MFLETQCQTIQPLDMVKYIHNEMNQVFRSDDTCVCHASIRKDWSNLLTYSDAIISYLGFSKKRLGDVLLRKYSDEYEYLSETEYLLSEEHFYNVANQCIENEESDVFMSVNSFYYPWRKEKTLRHLNAFVLDYDFKKVRKFKEMSARDFYAYIKPSLDIEPTFVVDSGRGLHLYFCIEHASKEMIPLYKRIYNALIQQQKANHVDQAVCNVSQLIRMAGTLNTRCLKTVEILEFHDNRKDIRQIAEEVLGSFEDFQKSVKTWQNNKSDASITSKKKPLKRKSMTDYQHASAVCKDFETLIQLRNQNGVLNGYRESLLFHAFECLLFAKTPQNQAEKVVLRLNTMFSSPLREDRVLSQCLPSEIFEHRTSIQKLIQKLHITEEEQKHMRRLRSKKEHECRMQRKKNRASSFRTNKQQAIHDRRLSIIKMLLKGYSKKEIMDELHISRFILLRDIQYIYGNASIKGHINEFKVEIDKWLLAVKNSVHELVCTLDELVELDWIQRLNEHFEIQNLT